MLPRPPGFRVHNFGKLAIRSFVNLARLWMMLPGRSPAPLSAPRLLNAGRGSWIRTCSLHADLCCGMITSTRMACGMARHLSLVRTIFFALLAEPSASAYTLPPGTWGNIFVAADAGSTYEPLPTLKYRWDPRRSVRLNRQYNVQGSQGVDLGPHPADPMAVHDGSQVEDEHLEGPNIIERRALGKDIYVHSGRGGYAPVLHVSTPDLAEFLRVFRYLSAHTPFGDSSYRFSLPNMRLRSSIRSTTS
jgi:hypothetical protein